MTTDNTDNKADAQALLAANAAFYAAFATGDAAAMEQLWSAHHEITCTHPGWPPLLSRDKVMESWHGILDNPPRPPIRAVEPTAHMGDGMGYVICYEAIGEVYLVATNVFVREGSDWKMIHHQSGESSQRPKSEPEAPQGTVH